MKTLTILIVITFGFMLIWKCFMWTEQRDRELMELCADPITQTLYNCNEKEK